jgi:hypothetical protein
MSETNKFVSKTVAFKGGSMMIEQVPHLKKTNQNFVEYFLPGSVSLKVSAIAEYMEDKELNTFNFKDFENYPEIEEKYIGL